MFREELQYMSSKLNGINSLRVFTDMFNNLQKSNKGNSKANNNKTENNFIDILDERMEKLEKIKDILKGNSYHLETKKKNSDLDGRNKKEPISQISQQLAHQMSPREKKEVTVSQQQSNQTNDHSLSNFTSAMDDKKLMTVIPFKKIPKFKLKDFKIKAKQIKSDKNILKLNINSFLQDPDPDNFNRNLNALSFEDRAVEHAAINIQDEDEEEVKNELGNTINSEKKMFHTSLSKDSHLFLTKLGFFENENEKRNLYIKKNTKDLSSDRIKLENTVDTFGKANQTIVSSSEIYQIPPPILKLEHPVLHTILYEPEKGKSLRRRGFSIKDENEVNMFFSAVMKSSNKNIKDLSYIPQPTGSLSVKTRTALNSIYTKCDNEMKVANTVAQLLLNEKQKGSKNDNDSKKVQIKGNEYLYENVNKAQNPFNADSEFKRRDMIIKVSERLAYANRDFFMKSFGYDYAEDEEFIFKDEVAKKQKDEEDKKINYSNKFRKVRDKHCKVEHILEKSSKGKDILINKVNDFINKVNMSRRGTYNLDENYPIDFLNIRKKKLTPLESDYNYSGHLSNLKSFEMKVPSVVIKKKSILKNLSFFPSIETGRNKSIV